LIIAPGQLTTHVDALQVAPEKVADRSRLRRTPPPRRPDRGRPAVAPRRDGRERDRRRRRRQGVRIADDLRLLLDAMVANAIVDGVAAKDRTELSALSGLPEARVTTTLRLGEESGVFECRVRT